MFRRNNLEMRVIILAPIGRDATLLASTLTPEGIETVIASDMESLLEMLACGVGAAIVADEALKQRSIGDLSVWLGSQPPWSDTPFLVLTSNGRPTHKSHLRALELHALGNFTLIERPVRPETVQSTVRTALRARMRQYEIRSRQEELLQANADLEQFAHSASHDLREPLRSMGIYSDLLARHAGALLDETGTEFLNEIRTGARRMDTLLSDLLSYAHASSISDEGIDSIQAIEPIDEALKSLAGAIRESEAEIKVGDMPVVRMRRSHMAQIFQNLISNAIKYRQENKPPMIDLSAQSFGSEWIFTVADNGIGVEPIYKETIFGIFKRLHSNSKYSGTGMGLAICQRIVERYRGRIWVESQLGQGSYFKFTVPI
jgi:signal transduction histidine kinase